MGPHWPHGQEEGVIEGKCSLPERLRVDEPFLLLNKKKKISFSLHLACSHTCIYVAVLETAMCSNRLPSGTLNKLACRTWAVRLNDFTVPEVVSFSCITPSNFFLPFTGHWSRSIRRGKKTYSLGMRFSPGVS